MRGMWSFGFGWRALELSTWDLNPKPSVIISARDDERYRCFEPAKPQKSPWPLTGPNTQALGPKHQSLLRV